LPGKAGSQDVWIVTHAWRCSSKTLWVGSRPALSSKHPQAIAVKPGLNAGFQKTVDPHEGQKWNSTGLPLPPIRTKTAEEPRTSVASLAKKTAIPNAEPVLRWHSRQ
jgi:hypothetical protein